MAVFKQFTVCWLEKHTLPPARGRKKYAWFLFYLSPDLVGIRFARSAAGWILTPRWRLSLNGSGVGRHLQLLLALLPCCGGGIYYHARRWLGLTTTRRAVACRTHFFQHVLAPGTRFPAAVLYINNTVCQLATPSYVTLWLVRKTLAAWHCGAADITAYWRVQLKRCVDALSLLSTLLAGWFGGRLGRLLYILQIRA